MIDPRGEAILELRAATAVAAIVGSKVAGKRRAKWKPPYVLVGEQGFTLSPFGPGSNRLGLQLVVLAIKCVAPNDEMGTVTARNLAGAVCDALNDKGYRKGSSVIVRSDVQSVAGDLTDPDTGDPFYIALVALIAPAQAGA